MPRVAVSVESIVVALVVILKLIVALATVANPKTKINTKIFFITILLHSLKVNFYFTFFKKLNVIF